MIKSLNMSVVFKKFLSKFFFKGYGYKFYPKKFKKKIRFKFFFLKALPTPKKNRININKKKFKIYLPSKKLFVKQEKIWSIDNLKDREDFSYLNRWTWAIDLFQNKKKITNKNINFVEKTIFDWCVLNSSKKISKENTIFEPYNISERICNYIILVKNKIISPNAYVLSSLEKQCEYLISNIEIYYGKNSNHALNNLRAIFLYSSYVDNKNISNYSSNFIIFILKKYIDKDGFFKFGSSYYQLIFTRWLSDILFSFKKKHQINYKKIENFYTKSLKASVFFHKSGKNFLFPNFGNISPDINSKWLNNFFTNKNSVFKKYETKALKISYKKKIKSREWFRLENKNWTLFCRNPKKTSFNFTHSHNDFFHYVLYYKNSPVVVDNGRDNYSSKSLKFFSSGSSHNSFTVNNNLILDEYLSYSLKSKFGLNNLSKCNYNVNSNYKNKLFITYNYKNFSLKRNITLLKKSVIIKNFISFPKLIELSMRTNFHPEILIDKNERKELNITLPNKTKLRIINNLTDCELKVKNSLFCSDYGNVKKSKSIDIIAKNIKEKMSLFLEIKI